MVRTAAASSGTISSFFGRGSDSRAVRVRPTQRPLRFEAAILVANPLADHFAFDWQPSPAGQDPGNGASWPFYLGTATVTLQSEQKSTRRELIPLLHLVGNCPATKLILLAFSCGAIFRQIGRFFVKFPVNFPCLGGNLPPRDRFAPGLGRQPPQVRPSGLIFFRLHKTLIFPCDA